MVVINVNKASQDLCQEGHSIGNRQIPRVHMLTQPLDLFLYI